MNGPNPLKAAWSMFRNQRTIRRPRWFGSGAVEHSALTSPLAALAAVGTPALEQIRPDLDSYIDEMSGLDPEQLSRPEALAFWLNLYNAGALRLAAFAFASGEESVLRVPGAFDKPFVMVGGETLSLDAIEHAKIRRFGDPRIHAAIVCGSISCPTLRPEPYEGGRIHEQLDSQMKTFLSSGGASVSGDTLMLSRVFLWYGADFVRPNRMPTWIPASRKRVAHALRPWLGDAPIERLQIEFQPYDWGLRCSVG
ncbi:MAG: DUF547 domain-containing protein [Acidimicrobiia bacterium]|nr:DUF547 domain-containing protein [Acidimicrobiia bacterium]